MWLKRKELLIPLILQPDYLSYRWALLISSHPFKMLSVWIIGPSYVFCCQKYAEHKGGPNTEGDHDAGGPGSHTSDADHLLSDPSSLEESDGDEGPSSSGTSGLPGSQASTVPPPTTASTPAPAGPSSATTTASTASTATTRSRLTVILPASQATSTAPTTVGGRESVAPVRVSRVRADRAGGSGGVADQQPAPPSAALANISHVGGVFEQTQAQSDAILGEMRTLVRSMDQRMGQFVDVIGEIVAVLRDKRAALTSQPPPPRAQPGPSDASPPATPEVDLPRVRAASPAVAPPPRRRGAG